MTRRIRPRALVVVVTALACGLGGSAGCAAPPPADPAARIGFSWLDDVARALTAFRTATRAPALAASGGRSVDDALVRLDDLVRNAPSRTPAVEARLAELAAARAQLVGVRAAVATADARGAGIPAAADTAAAGATAEPAVRRELKAAGEAVLRDVACDVAFDGLVPVDKEEVEARGYVDVVPNVPGLYDQPFRDAVVKFAQTRLAQAVGPGAGRFVDWWHYADGIEDNARTLHVGLDKQVVTPNGYRSQAFVQYVRLCLMLPR